MVKHPDENLKMFATHKKYNVVDNGMHYKSKVSVYQTNLIDILYELVCFDYFGSKEISRDEVLFLIHLHVNLESSRYKKEKSDTNFWLGLFGNMGEQKRFQLSTDFFDDFSREKYILENISRKKHVKNTNDISFLDEFFEETNLSTDEYSAILFVLFAYFTEISSHLNPSVLDTKIVNPVLSSERLIEMIKKYSITVEEVKKSTMKRQVFYLKPILELDGIYFSVNPFLLLCTFANSNYWVIRNKYKNLNTQKFTNAFGKYFEIYLEEVLSNCLSTNQYKNLEESSKYKIADWHLKIENYHFLVEQKSAISVLGIKQSKPDIEAMKKHILKNWGEAVKQLNETQKQLKIENAIKIILVYEDYYNSICLDKLFELNPSLENDKKFWLISIKDFEKLMHTYKTNPKLFSKIVSEKNEAELKSATDGREMSMFLSKNGIHDNEYLDEFGISKEYDKIEQLISNCFEVN